MADIYRDGVVLRPVGELAVGDRVDLEADLIADPDYHASGDPAASGHPEFQCEWQVVAEIERETPDCICVYFEAGFVCGFPPDHLVEVDGEQVRDGSV